MFNKYKTISIVVVDFVTEKVTKVLEYKSRFYSSDWLNEVRRLTISLADTGIVSCVDTFGTEEGLYAGLLYKSNYEYGLVEVMMF